jgi:hypothetical protein
MAIEFTFKPLVKWPREQTPAYRRKHSPFKRNSGYAAEQGADRRMPVGRSFMDLKSELTHLRVDGPVVIEAGFRERDIRLDGQPRSDAPQPAFPGVLISFRSKVHGPLQFSCDDCDRWQDNVRAIALTLERLRLADRYGVTKRGEQYTGWKALPAPLVTPPPMTVEEAQAFIRSNGGDYRAAAKRLHPDAGGSDEQWNKLQQARELAGA